MLEGLAGVKSIKGLGVSRINTTCPNTCIIFWLCWDTGKGLELVAEKCMSKQTPEHHAVPTSSLDEYLGE